MKNLFCFTNAKTTKGEAFGWRTAILYLAPASLSGENLCKHSTAECREVCLNTAGRGVFKNIQKSRLNKTQWMLEKPAEFWERIDDEINNHANYTLRFALKHRRVLRPCVRLNGTSDIWNTEMETIMHRNRSVQFYDYTKDINRMRMFMNGELPPNYHLTYSFGGSKASLDFCNVVVQNGFNVAVVFDCDKGKPLTKNWRSYDVIDGDTHDLRFLDSAKRNAQRVERAKQWTLEPEGYVIGLRAKGKATKADVEYGKTFVQPNIDDA
jgi:hypothetical protein